MDIIFPEDFVDYELLDSGDGFRLERFGKYTISRPDPQAIWKKRKSVSDWQTAQAVYKKAWENHGIPESWLMSWHKLRFYARLTPFKHTGVFPEQAAHWSWLEKTIKPGTKILNLFGYTGVSSLVCAMAGASVTHVDASKPTLTWARENAKSSSLEDKPIRWILDDALDFVKREVRRGSEYDAIIMDPPVYGHGPTGKIWDISKSLPELLHACKQILPQSPLFILINAYAVNFSALTLKNLLEDLDLNGKINCGELALRQGNSNRILSTGIWGKFETKDAII